MQIVMTDRPIKGLLKSKLFLFWLSSLLYGLILFLIPPVSLADPLPKSTLSNDIETFQLGCPNNHQRNTIEMNQCSMTIVNQLKAIEGKYVQAIYTRINSDYKDDPETLNELLVYIDEENKAWDDLINAASESTYTYWKGGTIRGVMGSGRKINLMKYRIHNQWQSWLTYMDSSPAVLPEPLFIDVDADHSAPE